MTAHCLSNSMVLQFSRPGVRHPRGSLYKVVYEYFLKSGDFLDVSVKVEEVDGFDLYILDGIHVSLEDFEVLGNLIDGGLEYVYGSGQVPFSILASAIRAATTFQCPGIRSWAIQSIEEIWNPRRAFLKPLSNASQVLTLARTYHMAETVTDRALYELLRAENFDELRNMHPPSLQKRLDIARGKCTTRGFQLPQTQINRVSPVHGDLAWIQRPRVFRTPRRASGTIISRSYTRHSS
ncbi:hypothetical protein B0H14DRAFT_2498271 [Mycena olivaceomarginata]|nr:hypothetical protein B0H14DRAFT_2498271 [Mycena olivaceomarginata]